MSIKVIAVHKSSVHYISKENSKEIKHIEGKGVEGDAHMGKFVKHRSRVRKDPTQPNLRQVHLIHGELYDELNAKGFELNPGEMGENITTYGLDLLKLPESTRLYIGESVEIEITGLRNPCDQLNGLRPGLMSHLVEKKSDGSLERKAGVMSIVLKGGPVKSGDIIKVVLPQVQTPLFPV